MRMDSSPMGTTPRRWIREIAELVSWDGGGRGRVGKGEGWDRNSRSGRAVKLRTGGNALTIEIVFYFHCSCDFQKGLQGEGDVGLVFEVGYCF